MPKIINYTLNPDDLARLERAMESDPRHPVRQRATAIRLLHLGFAASEVAVILNVRQATVYYWHARWREGGLEGLADKPGRGRKLKADAAYAQALERALEQSPPNLGYPFSLWTVDRLREHLARQTGVKLSKSRFRALLKRQGYVYRRPKKTLTYRQDVDAREQAQALLDELKKGRRTTVLSSSLWTKRA